MTRVRTSIALAAASAALLAGVAPASATEHEPTSPPAPAPAPAPKTVWTGHASLSAVIGLPVGRRVTVVQSCPAGSRIDKGLTRNLNKAAVSQEPSKRVRFLNREVRATSVVTRYRVTRKNTARFPAALTSAIACKRTVAGDAVTMSGKAATDLRVWGPATKGLTAANASLFAASDSRVIGAPDFVSTMAAAGVTRSRGAVNAFTSPMQELVTEDGEQAVVAAGETTRTLRRGTFASLRNNYTFTSDLTHKK